MAVVRLSTVMMLRVYHQNVERHFVKIQNSNNFLNFVEVFMVVYEFHPEYNIQNTNI